MMATLLLAIASMVPMMVHARYFIAWEDNVNEIYCPDGLVVNEIRFAS